MSKAWPVRDVDPNDSFATNARRILRVRVGEFYAFEPVVDDATAIQPLHDLRISAKRLRYTLELFRSVFGESGEQNIERIKAVQEALGDLHDTDVRIELIRAELLILASEQIDELGRALLTAPSSLHAALITATLRPPPDDPRRGLVALFGREYARRLEHFEHFNALWHQFDNEQMRVELVALSQMPGK